MAQTRRRRGAGHRSFVPVCLSYFALGIVVVVHRVWYRGLFPPPPPPDPPLASLGESSHAIGGGVGRRSPCRCPAPAPAASFTRISSSHHVRKNDDPTISDAIVFGSYVAARPEYGDLPTVAERGGGGARGGRPLLYGSPPTQRSPTRRWLTVGFGVHHQGGSAVACLQDQRATALPTTTTTTRRASTTTSILCLLLLLHVTISTAHHDENQNKD